MVSTLTGGGAERTVSNLSQYFPNDYELDVLVNCKTENDYPFKGNIITLGMDYRVNKSTWYQIRAFVKRIIKLREIRKHNHYEAVLSLIDSSSVANILTRKYGGKTIVSVRCVMSTNDTFQYKYIVNPLVKAMYNKADKVVALSKGVEDDLREHFAIKPELLTTIYNGYDINRAVEGATKKENDVFTFISMGRLETQKGQWHLIRAFNELAKPSQKNPVTYYSSVKPMLFQETISKFGHTGHGAHTSSNQTAHADATMNMNMGHAAHAGAEE